MSISHTPTNFDTDRYIIKKWIILKKKKKNVLSRLKLLLQKTIDFFIQNELNAYAGLSNKTHFYENKLKGMKRKVGISSNFFCHGQGMIIKITLLSRVVCMYHPNFMICVYKTF